MITSPTLTAASDGTVRQTRTGGRITTTTTTTPRMGAVEAPAMQEPVRIDRSEHHRGDGDTGDRVIPDRQTAISDPLRIAARPGDPAPADAPVRGDQQELELAWQRMVDRSLLGIAASVIAAFLWMCAGTDDLSDPVLILFSLIWHTAATMAIAAVTVSLWQLVRGASWTMRLVLVGILLLNWVLTRLMG